MATTRRVVEQHQDWLTLTEPEAPWFSVPALKRAFPAGLDPTPPEMRAGHKARWHFDPNTGVDRGAYIEWLLREVLDWGDDYLTGEFLPEDLASGVQQHGVTVAASGVYQPKIPTPVGVLPAPTAGPDPSAAVSRVLVFVLASGTDPRLRPPGDVWPAAWVQRAALACRHHHVALALITDGDHVALVHAPPRAATGWGVWRASEFASEPVLLDSLRSMLHARRFTAAAPGDTPAALLEESARSQAEVTDQLGSQVRRATELLVNAISRANRDRHGTLLSGVAPSEVYEAAVTVMMRAVFLLVAEENNLLPADNPHYQTLYSIRSLRETLEQERYDNPEALETRTTAWHQLLATSRALHSGVFHEELTLPAYGGSLFDPDRFPFLEGRPKGTSWHTDTGAPIAVTDVDVLAILDSLLVLRFAGRRSGAETARLSYRNVDVEQIGHIYERLLDHGAVTADEVIVGLRGKPGEEPEVALSALELRMLSGKARVAEWLSDKDAQTNNRRAGTRTQIEKLLAEPVDGHLRTRLRQACQGDETLAQRVEPFARLLRLDLHDRPLVFHPDDLYVTETGSRRDTGTAYTTRELADEIAEHTLAPLCYDPGPQDTDDTNQWRIRPSEAILDLKVCDPAVGSGAILVAACRYLADRLIEARATEGDARAAATATAADNPEHLDVVIETRRAVAERCCYGVDLNPMATEMAKLSMWLTTVAKDRPFTFLDHAIKTGDSLLGIRSLTQLRHLHYDPATGKNRPEPIPEFVAGGAASETVERLVAEALQARQQMRSIDTVAPADIEHKQELHQRSETALEALTAIADTLTAAALTTAGDKDPAAALTRRLEADTGAIVELVDALDTPQRHDTLSSLRDTARDALDAGRPDNAAPRVPLHWPVAFPEACTPTGEVRFDAMVGNPPFLGGKRITGAAGTDYRNHLIAWTGHSKKGSADLVAYFFLLAAQTSESFGFLATNTIAQGDTSEVGLTQIIDNDWTIHRAVPSTEWPGDTSLEIAKVWATRRPWHRSRLLDGRPVAEIDEMLYAASGSGWRKQRLAANNDRAFIGSYVLGTDGFTMTPQQAQALISKDPRNADVLAPYLGGEDLNQSPTLTAPRWIINFQDWNKKRAEGYPACFKIIEEQVKPVRQERKPNGEFKKRKPLPQRYWIYADKRPKLYQKIKPLRQILAISRVGDTAQPVFVATGQVLADSMVVFVYSAYFHFGVLTSGFHFRWALRHCSTLGAGVRYTPSDVFETFPQPPYSKKVEEAGEKLDTLRTKIMSGRNLGLTDVYNLVHDPAVDDDDIEELRGLHTKLDLVVRDAYGWRGLDLGHGFHEVRGQGVRFTFSPQASDVVLERLLMLNQQRYLAEQAARPPRPAKPAGKAAPGQQTLLGDPR